MASLEQSECMGCGQPCVGFYCYLCTCQQCGFSLSNGTCINCTYGDGKPVTCCECESPLNGGFCLFCNSRAGNSSAYDPNPNSYNDSPNFSDYTPQPQYQPILCEFCGNDARYGHYCTPQVPIISNPEPCYNQNYDEFPQTLPSFQQQILCCENCGGPHATFECQPMNQNFHDSNSSGFDQFQPPQFLVIHQPPKEMRMEALQAREDLMESIQNFLKKFNRISFRETPKVLMQAWDKFFEVKHAQSEEVQELLNKLLQDVRNVNEELAEYINTPSWNRPAFYYDDDDDDEEYTIAITPVLPTVEPDNSLSMGDEHLSTIPEKEESSVEDLVPIPSESEGIPDNMCDVPFRDNSPPLDISKDQFEGFSDSNDDSTSIDDDSFSIDDINYVEASPPDSELVSLEIEALKDNPTLSSDFVTNSGSPTSYLDLSLPDYEAFFCDSELDSGNFTMGVVEDIFDNPTREPRVHVPNDLSTHPTLHLDSDFTLSSDSPGSDLVVSFPSGTRNKIFDSGIFIEVQYEKFLSRDEFSISFIRDPLSPVIDTLLPFLSKNEDKVVNSGILAADEEKSPHPSSHRGLRALNESPMMISGEDIPILDVPFLHFYPP
ncbi:hypothetical protein Tco_0405690 [Tanacetum coccineum]